MKLKLIDAFDLGGDVLRVVGQLGTGKKAEPVEAFGWVSAIENHFGPEAHRQDGTRKKNAKPRPMDKAERRAYCEQLLADAIAAAPAPEPRSLLDG